MSHIQEHFLYSLFNLSSATPLIISATFLPIASVEKFLSKYFIPFCAILCFNESLFLNKSTASANDSGSPGLQRHTFSLCVRTPSVANVLAVTSGFPMARQLYTLHGITLNALSLLPKMPRQISALLIKPASSFSLTNLSIKLTFFNQSLEASPFFCCRSWPV